VLALLGLTLVHTVCEGVHGSTIGKRLCGITVVAEDGSPSRPAMGLKRSLGFLVDQFVFGLVGVHRILNSPLQQRVGDEWAGTRVVRLSAVAPSARRSRARFLAAAAASLLLSGAIGFVGTLAQVRHHARLAARDSVEIVDVSRRPGRERIRPGDGRVAVQVRYELRSAAFGSLQLFVLQESDPAPQGGRYRVGRGSGSVALEAEVRLTPGRPEQPDDEIFVGLYPDRNEEEPSAMHGLAVRLVPCGPGLAKRPPGDLCIE
jgi:hypothetical protein